MKFDPRTYPTIRFSYSVWDGPTYWKSASLRCGDLLVNNLGRVYFRDWLQAEPTKAEGWRLHKRRHLLSTLDWMSWLAAASPRPKLGADKDEWAAAFDKARGLALQRLREEMRKDQ
jgi:hypothetical protein